MTDSKGKVQVLPIDEIKYTKTKKTKTKNTQPKAKISKIILMLCGFCIWTYLATYAAQYIVAYPMCWILGDTVRQPVWTSVYDALAYVMSFIITVSIPYALYRKKHFHKEGYTKESNPYSISKKLLGIEGLPTWIDLGLAPVAFIVYLVIASVLVNTFTSTFPWFNPDQAQDVGFAYTVAGLDKIVTFIALVVVAPIAEELIFRGWLYGNLRKKLPVAKEALSIILCSLFVSVTFGILHGQWNVGVNVFALSLVLCGLREITGTIHAGIVLHMLKNGIAFWLLYVLGIS